MLIEKTLPSGKADSNPLRILESIPDGFISVDSNWIIQYCNRNSEKILGIPRESMTGLNLWECFPGCEHLKFFSELHKAMELRQPVFFEEYYRPLQLWVEISAHFAEGLLSIYFKDVGLQKEQERKLKEMNERYAYVMRFVSEAIWEWEIGAATAAWHGDSLTKLLGYQPEDEKTVACWEESVHPDDLPKVKHTFQTTLVNGESYYTNDYRLKKKNGEYIHVRDRASIIRSTNGTPVKVIGVTDDITVQKQYEAALMEAKETYQSLFDNAPLPKRIYDRQTLRFIDVNTAAVNQYGYSREEFLKMTLLDIRPRADHQKLTERIENDKPISGEWIHLKKDGGKIFVEVSLTVLEYQGKSACLASLNDITERKKAELDLKASQQKLSNMLESIGDGFFAVDKNWTVIYQNGKAEKLLNRKKEQFLGKNLWEVFKDAVNLKFYSEYHRAMEENIPVCFEEYYPGLNAWFEVNAYPTEEGLSVYFKNITEKKQQEEERKENAAKLVRAEEELHHVLEAMTDGFYTLDRNWNIKYATDKVAAMLGINKNDYVGKNLWDFAPEAVNTKFYTEYHRAFEEGKPVSFEEYLSTYNMWFEVNAYPLKNVLSVYVKNITKRKNDEKRLEFIARATSEVIWEREVNSGEAFINAEKFRSVFGYHLPGNSIPYSFWRDKVHFDDVDSIIKRNQLAFENDFDYHMHEYRLKKADETWAWVKDRVYVIRDEANRPVRMIGAMEDVTNEHLAEKALLESEQTYKQLFDHASLPKVIYDRESLQILNVNSAAVEHYGYSREEFLSMTVLDIRPAKDHAKAKVAASRPSKNAWVNLGTWTHIKKGGEQIQVEVSTATINYKDKVCNIATIHDVTEKLRLQAQLIKEKIESQRSITKATLKAQEKERSEIGRELHDGINQVLTTAKLYIENIKYFPEQRETFVDKSISLLQKSINEIRVLSKALVTPTITDIGFQEALSEMIKCYEELKLFEIHYTIQEGTEKIEHEVKLTMYRIIQEQLNNITKYAKASLVKVQILLKKQELLVLVEDNGVGFDPTQKKTGIGLCNMKNRAELFKGKVKIKSAPGKGCKIEIAFPV